MLRPRFDRRRSTDLLMRCVSELEVRTSAEVVLAIRKQSGSYADINWLVGSACSFLLLNFILFAPQEVHPLEIPLPILLAFFGGAALSEWTGLSAKLTGAPRKLKQVEDSAQKLFRDHVAGKTRAKTGVLIYLSIRERAAHLEADTGVLTALNSELLQEFRERFELELRECPASMRADRIGGVLRTFGVALERNMPPEESIEERDNQLADDILLHSNSERPL